MSFAINTNITSLEAQNYLRKSADFQKQTIGEVTSGLRIINSGDDAAGLAIANGLRSDQAVLGQGIRNAGDGLSTLQTIDGGINNISTLLDRARTLATQSASGTFTGDRSVLNAEFQSVLSEVDRQAQSIGLNSGGQFAKALSVFIGGGRASGAVTAASNGSVSIDLSQSTVDTKSLGLKGVQAQVSSSIDLGSASATSVQNIIADTTNKASESVSGSTTFSFKGPGFSDGNALNVSVNLSGVTNTQTLATAINSAIQSAGNGATAAATAFKNANISATVVTDASGKQQIAFGSSTTAFEVQAGDKTANALLGNISSGTTGADLTTTFAGASNLTTANVANQASTIKLQFQGAGMTSPETISVNVAKGDTVASVLTNVASAVSGDAALAKAGISVLSDATHSTNGHALTFQSSSGQQFSVISGGDTQNLLGLGSRQLGGAGDTSVQYSTTTGTSYDNTTKTGTANFEFSFNGASSSSNALSADLSGGNATAGNVTGATVTNGTVDTSTANKLSLTVDGTTYNVDLSASSHNGSAESLAQVATDITSALGANGSATVSGTGQLVITSATKGAASSVVVNAGANGSSDAAAALNLTGGAGAVATAGVSRTGSDLVADLNQQIAQNSTLSAAGIQATYSGGQITFASSGGSNATQFQLNAFGSSTAAAVTGAGGGSAATVTGTVTGSQTITAANQNLGISIDGTQYNVTLTTGTRTMAQIAGDIQSALTAQGSNATAGVDGTGHLQITSGSTGASSNVTVGNTNPNDASSLVGLTAASATGTAATSGTVTGTVAAATFNISAGSNDALSLTVDGVAHSVTLTAGAARTIAQVISDINTAVGSTVASNDGSNHIVLTSTTTGTSSGMNIGAVANDAYTDLGFTVGNHAGAAATSGALTAGTVTGSVTVTASNNTLDLSVDGTQHKVTLANGSTTIASVASQINTQVGSNIASVDGGGHLVLASTTTGASSNITLGNNDAFDGATVVGVNGATNSGTGNFTVTAGTNDNLTFKVDGGANQTITLSAGTYTAATLATEINTQLTAGGITGISATNNGGKLVLQNTASGSDHSVQVVSGGLHDASTTFGLGTTLKTGTDANVGFGAQGASFTGNVQGAAPTTSPNVVSAGAYQAQGFTFSALANGSDSQTINISATDANGQPATSNIVLHNNTSNQNGATIDSTLNAINTALQQSNQAALQGITAVKYNDAGTEKISFVSASSKFSVTVGNTGSNTGLSGAGTTTAASVVGSGSTASISDQETAQSAVTALAAAVQALGKAQAVVGRGENSFNYAVNLAQSQVTNEAAAESQIRDADLAQEAANLTKAQILVQAGTAALSQANSAPQAILSLLQGH